MRLTDRNIDQLAPVAEDVFDHPLVPVRLAAYVAIRENIFVVAIRDNLTVGHIRGTIIRQPDRNDDAYVDNFGVSPEHQRRGIGRALYEAFAKHAGNLGADNIWLATETYNDGAIAFYRALGLHQQIVAYFSTDKT